MGMIFELTELSQKALSDIQGSNMSAEEAREYLMKNVNMRTFSETISKLYNGENLRGRLVEGLVRVEGISEESSARKVRAWLSDKYAPTKRETLIHICFALGLDYNASNILMSFSDEGGLHLRNPKEIIYAYALKNKKNYAEATNLIAVLADCGNNKGNTDLKNLVMTQIIADEFENIGNDDAALRRFFEKYCKDLDVFHNTAYKQFHFMINLLIRPGDETEKYSVESVVDEYLRMKLPMNRKTAKMNFVQKTIRKYWPNASQVVRMLNRSEDITRKILLLLYLVTNGSLDVNSEEDYLLDEDLTAEELFEEHYWRLNSMLSDCGLSLIDPRSTFDWVVLYCLNSADDEFISERMEKFLDSIFNNIDDEEEIE